VVALFTHADRLGRLLTDYPEVVVVVSSSWRESYSLEQLRELCGPLLGPRLQDVTGIVTVALGVRLIELRFEEIADWLATHPKPIVDSRDPAADALVRHDWIALDDSDFWFPPGCPQLIHIAEGLGLNDAHFAEIEARLVAHRRAVR
jgi:hypothetical protein